MMTQATVRQLNHLNKAFYEKTAEHFSDSRSYYWQGWNRLVPYINDIAKNRQRITVLDIGAGNGRFGKFVNDQLPEHSIGYVAVDSDRQLLNLAEENYQELRLEPTFIKMDIVDALIRGTLVERLKPHKGHMVLLLGVLHHIPSAELRAELIKTLGELVIKDGFLAFTTWNFMESERLRQKIVDPAKLKKLDLDPADLEEHDVILDWQRGVTAYRYCHYTDRDERHSLVEQSGLELATEFTADGKSGHLNTYVVLQKK